MRLLQVISSMEAKRGGPAQGVRNFAPMLKKLGVVNEVLTLDCEEPKELEGVEFVLHPKGPGKTSWGYSAGLRDWLEVNIDRFDAVIIRECWQYPLIAAATVCRKKGIPYIIMPHGTLDPWFQRDPNRRLKSLRNWFYWKLLLGRQVEGAEAMFFTGETEKLLARETFRPYRPKREIVVGYGIVDPADHYNDQAETQTFREDGSPGFLLFLGRIDPKKGVDLLIQSYAKLCAKVNRSNPIPDLVIAGPGLESSFGQKCLDLCRKAGLDVLTENAKPDRTGRDSVRPGRVIFPGLLVGDDKWAAFRLASAMVLPSHQENFGITVAEALACGTPVLISDQVNIWREISDAGAGLVAADTLDGTFQLLKDWVNLTLEEQNEMRSKARQCFEEHFRVEGAAKNLAETIKSLI